MPDQQARDTLIGDAEWLIQQLSELLNDPGAVVPVAGQPVPV